MQSDAVPSGSLHLAVFLHVLDHSLFERGKVFRTELLIRLQGQPLLFAWRTDLDSCPNARDEQIRVGPLLDFDVLDPQSLDPKRRGASWSVDLYELHGHPSAVRELSCLCHVHLEDNLSQARMGQRSIGRKVSTGWIKSKYGPASFAV